MYFVDLNSDLGESFGNYTIGMDEEILKYVSSANVACGWHAGDAMVMEKTVALAKQFGTAVGAHPGFPDLMGFGRRNMAVTPEEAKAIVEGKGGFLRSKWCGSLECELAMKERAGVSSRCMPLVQSGTEGTCPVCGRKCTTDIYWGVAY